VEHISSRVAVMYLGKMAELASRGSIFENPLHPYTQALMSAIPVADPRKAGSRDRIILEGDVPSPINPPAGCHFHPRCRYAMKGLCDQEEPVFKDYGDGHYVACWLVEKEAG
jgi:oligopeptide transport system ATP-binding protein